MDSSPRASLSICSRTQAGAEAVGLAVFVLVFALGCGAPTEPERPMRPQTVTLLVTPKMLADFGHPEIDIEQFLLHYEPLIARASETIVIFAVGNSDHILTYRGPGYLNDAVEWARFTDGRPVSFRSLSYAQIENIVRVFKSTASAKGFKIKIFDQVDPGNEFTDNPFKYLRHSECMDLTWMSFDIRGRLRKDSEVYATARSGTVEGTLCGSFLVDQANAYLRDLGFDGLMYGNQFGTRGRWLPDNGPGYSLAEATAIHDFLDYSRRILAEKELMWFDSYNNVDVERTTFSFPRDGYHYFDYIVAAGFCVISFPDRYVDDLRSKLALTDRHRVLATLDYVDPWYTYNSMTSYPDESARLEQIAIAYRSQIDGIVFFANDEMGSLVPRPLVESFARRFFGRD